MCSHACAHVYTQQIDVNSTFFNVTKERHSHNVFSRPVTVYMGPCDKQELGLKAAQCGGIDAQGPGFRPQIPGGNVRISAIRAPYQEDEKSERCWATHHPQNEQLVGVKGMEIVQVSKTQTRCRLSCSGPR